MKHIVIGLVDNDPLTTNALSGLIKSHFGERVGIWSTSDEYEAIRRCLEAATRPNLLFLDMSMEHLSGIEACNIMRQHISDMPIIGITSFSLQTYQERIADAGAQALVSKTDIDSMLNIISSVLNHRPYQVVPPFLSVTEAYDRIQYKPKTTVSLLTRRDADIMDLVAEGLNNNEIAARLSISESTVKTHIEHILDKLGAHNRTHAAVIWIKGRL
ncbi:response regulator transcription factor [Bifidobacterium amazonense]|uniref:Response regulator transcription factor n=1 Tax=Bifidobacterium amazonense TaxID=2809027 RepID=A0ABS9VWJ5_9BIFI|nr:response regulator transcription factor [Bifidobacterium amazonense]MCH9276481.1 response regulator transcription factor [Bifidobacterium amazonense]